MSTTVVEDPEQKQFDLQMSKTIEEMPEEVKDRFKALKVLYVNIQQISNYLIGLRS